MTLDAIAKLVGIGVGLTVATTTVLREIREQRQAKKSTAASPSTSRKERWSVFRFVLTVASISFFTTLATQYIYPPYAVWSPKDYKPLLSHSTVTLLWFVGISLLLFLSGIPRAVLHGWGKANIRERVAQAIIFGLAIILAALILASR